MERTITSSSMDVRPDRVTTLQRNSLQVRDGESVFNVDTGELEYWNGSSWIGEGAQNPTDLDNRIIVTQANKGTTLGGVIDSTKEYFIDGVIDMEGTSITVPPTGIQLRGYSFDVSKLISSNTSYTMFVSESIAIGSGNILGMDYAIEVTGAGSKVYELYDATGFNAFEFLRINYNNCTNLGDIYDYRQGLESGTGRFGGSPSLTLHGLWRGGYRITTSIVRSLAGTMTAPLFKKGTLFQMDSRFLTDINCDLPTLAPFCDFETANFPNPSTIQIDSAIFSRDGGFSAEDSNIFPNLNPSDLPCQWKNNKGLGNTFVGGTSLVVLEGATTINTQGVYEYIDAGAFLGNELQHFEITTNEGWLRHIGDNPREFELSVSLAIDGAQNGEVSIQFFKWDDSESQEEALAYTIQRRPINNLVGGRDVAFFFNLVGVTLDQNDELRLKIANETGTQDLTVEALSFFRLQER